MTAPRYEKQPMTKCEITGRYGYPSNFLLAKQACDSDRRCRGVYDNLCDDEDAFRLCPWSGYMETSSSSCVYEKMGS